MFVSLPRKTIPEGVSAVIANHASGQSIAADLSDGGLDPTQIAGTTGDTLEVIVSLSGGGQKRFVLTVPLRAPPKVVRTSPPPQKRDVPLNASIVVVFSEPIGASSLAGGALQLRRGTDLVPGVITFGNAAQTSLTLTPDQPLAPSTEYVLLVSEEVRDLDGEQLEASVAVPFTTAPSMELPEPGQLTIRVITSGSAPDPDGYLLVVGSDSAHVTANSVTNFALPPGSYTPALRGLASNCLFIGYSWLTVTLPLEGATYTLQVACPSLGPGSLMVTVSTKFLGSGWPTTFPMQIDTGVNQQISANGYVVILSVASGSHSVAVKTPYGGGAFCMPGPWPPSDGWRRQSVTMPVSGPARVDFAFLCIP